MVLGRISPRSRVTQLLLCPAIVHLAEVGSEHPSSPGSSHRRTASSAPGKGFVWQRPPHASHRLVSWSPWGLALAGAGETKGDVVPHGPVFGFSLGIFLPRFSSSGVWDGSVRRERRGRQPINRVMAHRHDGSHEVRVAGAWDVGSALPCRGSSAALFSGINPHHHPPALNQKGKCSEFLLGASSTDVPQLQNTLPKLVLRSPIAAPSGPPLHRGLREL